MRDRETIRGHLGGLGLVLLITEVPDGNGRLRLDYRCSSRDPGLVPSFEPFRSEAFDRQGLLGLDGLFSLLEKLPLAQEEQRRTAARRLIGVGLRLGRQLIPVALNQRLWELRDRAIPLQVVSSEAWIPWELLTVEDPQGTLPATFLAEAFDLCRWFQGFSEALSFPLQRLAVVSPSDSRLTHALRECGALLVGSEGTRRVEPAPARLPELLEAMESGHFDGWHFSGHGLVRGSVPEQWSLQLERPHQLTAVDLEGVRPGFGRQRPFVFLNACRSAKGGRALVGDWGLASAFVAAGAGAFVGAMWAIDDEPAEVFARQLYAELMAGRTLGESVRRSRLHLRDAFPGDPTWLAYAVYGHPLARVEQKREKEAGTEASANDWSLSSPKELVESPSGIHPPISRGSWISRGKRLVWRPGRMALVFVLLVALGLFWWSRVGVGRRAPVERPPASALSEPQTLLSPEPGAEVSGGAGKQARNPFEFFLGRRDPSGATLGGAESPRPKVGDAEAESHDEIGDISKNGAEVLATAREVGGDSARDGGRGQETGLPEAGLSRPQPQQDSPESGSVDGQSAAGSKPPRAVPRSQMLAVREIGALRSEMAAMSLAVGFHSLEASNFVKLIAAPDGREAVEKVFYDADRPSFTVRSSTGTWRIQVLDLQRSKRELRISLSEEIP